MNYNAQPFKIGQSVIVSESYSDQLYKYIGQEGIIKSYIVNDVLINGNDDKYKHRYTVVFSDEKVQKSFICFCRKNCINPIWYDGELSSNDYYDVGGI